MRIYSINPDDASQKLSFAYAMGQGYKLTLDADGSAEVANGDGAVYHIHAFKCDCPDAAGRDGGTYTRQDGTHFCKHVAWVAQLHPCANCGATMIEHQMDQGCGIKFFACHNCCAIKAAGLIKVERQRQRQQEGEIAEIIEAGEEASRAVFAD